MSDIDRVFRELVRTVDASCPQYLNAPFDVGELYQTILPYRHHRRELGFESNQDYEMALTELLSGAGGYLIVDDRMREALQKELASRNPDPAAFREFATVQVTLNPEAVARVRSSAAPATATASGAPRASAAPKQAMPDTTASPADAPILAPEPRMPTPSATAGRPQAGVVPKTGETCRYCGGTLPSGRRITFCPHCGQNLTTVNCPACGTELEVGWKFCTTCGRPAASTT